MSDPRTTNSPPKRRRIPLRVRLSLGSALRLALAIVAFGLIAWRQARQAALEGAAERARAAAVSLATRSSLGLQNVVESARQAAADRSIVAALRDGALSPEAHAVL